MENIYRTAQVAKMIGIHPNTVRLYEQLELIPEVKRLDNGYRVFTDYHIEQFKLVRKAFEVEVLQNGLRKKIVKIIKLSAKGEFKKAIESTNDYINQIKIEKANAEEAIVIVDHIFLGLKNKDDNKLRTRKETAQYLNITMDTLRNWEMNGLLSVKRKENGYRIYTESDIERLKIIRTLRCSNYSLSSILRMLNALSRNKNTDIREIINTPNEDEDIVTACDKLLISLNKAEENAITILEKLYFMQRKFINSPL